MRTAEAFYNIFMYLYNKNILEYAQIARSGPKSMFPNIEGPSNKYKIYRIINKKTHYYKKCKYKKGIIGNTLSFIGVVEDHVKGTLHFHIIFFGSISPYILQ